MRAEWSICLNWCLVEFQVIQSSPVHLVYLMSLNVVDQFILENNSPVTQFAIEPVTHAHNPNTTSAAAPTTTLVYRAIFEHVTIWIRRSRLIKGCANSSARTHTRMDILSEHIYAGWCIVHACARAPQNGHPMLCARDSSVSCPHRSS